MFCLSACTVDATLCDGRTDGALCTRNVPDVADCECYEGSMPGASVEVALGADEDITSVCDVPVLAACGFPALRCHMPWRETEGRRYRSHRFASTRDVSAFQRALDIEVERGDGALKFLLTPRGVGHAFPTGDLFRRVRLSAVARGPDGIPDHGAQRYLARHFERQRVNGSWRLVETYDDRIGAGCAADCASQVTLELGLVASNAPIEYVVAYERVDYPEDGSEDRAVVSDRVIIARGVR